MQSHDDYLYKPKHHHIPRVAGSSTGGVSQITFGDEAENVPPPATGKTRGGDAVAASFAERNASSSIFNFGPASETPRPSTGRARVPGSTTAQVCTFALSYDEPAPAAPANPFGDRPQAAQQRAPRSNPIFGGDFEAMSAHQPMPDRPSTARSRSDPNRPSQEGGIFGSEPSTPSFVARRHLAIEEAPMAKYGSKRMNNGRMEYCA